MATISYTKEQPTLFFSGDEYKFFLKLNSIDYVTFEENLSKPKNDSCRVVMTAYFEGTNRKVNMNSTLYDITKRGIINHGCIHSLGQFIFTRKIVNVAVLGNALTIAWKGGNSLKFVGSNFKDVVLLYDAIWDQMKMKVVE